MYVCGGGRGVRNISTKELLPDFAVSMPRLLLGIKTRKNPTLCVFLHSVIARFLSSSNFPKRFPLVALLVCFLTFFTSFS